MYEEPEDVVLTTKEACHYLRISRPTYVKYLYEGKIRGAIVGKGWKILKSELDRFLKGGNGNWEGHEKVRDKVISLNSRFPRSLSEY